MQSTLDATLCALAAPNEIALSWCWWDVMHRLTCGIRGLKSYGPSNALFHSIQMSRGSIRIPYHTSEIALSLVHSSALSVLCIYFQTCLVYFRKAVARDLIKHLDRFGQEWLLWALPFALGKYYMSWDLDHRFRSIPWRIKDTHIFHSGALRNRTHC